MNSHSLAERINREVNASVTLLSNKVTQKNDHFYSAEVLKVGLWLSNDPDNYDYFQNTEKTKWPIIYGE